ncbi:putative ABC transporter ATP-binding protein YknU [Caldalkalibacillus thermarum]|uniref:ABC transporter ATP-binding protein n=1 Tax=Caldalkalibacillus thermarum TaxID=296745 RepID=UPI00166DCA41|nr:ABC transporter ATP-binding protein [Caldalkalibacillus thermarum]GGK29904.1 putative ABC transporter ATP-binding protein YknU [Caldalkalibacillus thermarum]
METFKRLKSFYWPYKRDFVWSILALVVVSGLTVFYPLVLKFVIDDIIQSGQWQLVPYAALAFIVLMGIKAWFLYIHQYYGDLFGIQAVYALRNALYRKLQQLPFRFYDNAKTGDLMSRLAQDVEVFRFFLSFGCAQVVNFVLLVGTGFVVMLFLHVHLALLTLALLPFLLLVVYRFDRQVHPAFRAIRWSLAQLTTRVQENVSGINTVKALSQEETEIKRFDEKNEDYRAQHLHTADIWARYFPLMELIGHLCVVVLLAYGGYLVIEGELPLGSLVAFFSLIWYIVGPLMGIGFIINTFSQSKAAGERLLEILDEEVEIREADSPLQPERLKGHVRFEHVTHYYRGEEKPALVEVSFDAPPGKVIGLLGATGAGKTTLVQLISRFYEPQEGQIWIDQQPVSRYALKTLRSQIGVVFQEPFLFSASIKANIAYGKPEASMEEIVAAAKRADAHDFISALPQGYDTILGERGAGLSGGQKQRISIARALLINPSILILDDATSAVDMTTERRIQRALRELMQGRTTFIIAHRISSLQKADEILVLDSGRVVERGTHQELIRRPHGIYRHIYAQQYQDYEQVLAAKQR